MTKNELSAVAEILRRNKPGARVRDGLVSLEWGVWSTIVKDLSQLALANGGVKGERDFLRSADHS